MTLIKVDHTEYGLEEKKAQDIANMFKPMLDQMESLEVQYNEVIAMEMSPERQQQARDIRLAYVKVRTGTDKIHKALKAFYLQGGRFVDGWRNAQRMASLGNEEKLKEIEEYYERQEKERVARLYEERSQELRQYTEFIPMELGEMDKAVWDNYLAGAKHTHEETKRIEGKMEEERQSAQRKIEAREKRERAELDRLRKERKKKEAEQAEKDRIQAEKLEEERLAREKAEEDLRVAQEAEQSRIKADEERKEAELKKGDEEKVNDLCEELMAIREKYTFKSKKNQEMYHMVVTEISGIILAIKVGNKRG